MCILESDIIKHPIEIQHGKSIDISSNKLNNQKIKYNTCDEFAYFNDQEKKKNYIISHLIQDL